MISTWSPENLGAVGFILVFVAGLYLSIQREWFVTGKAHKREVAAREREIAVRDDREKAMAATHAESIREMRLAYETAVARLQENHEKQMAGVRGDHGAQVAMLQRDVDDWRGAYHIGAENWKASEDRMDEVVEGTRLSVAALNAIRAIAERNSTPQLGGTE
jgi:hypothetical protein